MTNRRQFLKYSGLMGGAVLLKPDLLLAEEQKKKLTILHTNDWHSRIEPFPMDGSKNQGKGGAARRAELIRKIREQEKDILLLDSGDIFQGTPYFNIYGGEVEYKLMSAMGYDAVTLGNHDFDGGVDGIYKQFPHARFDILTANYDFSKTSLEGLTRPWKVYRKNGIKVGIFGLGIELKNLVPDHLVKGVTYLDPLETAEQVGDHLRNKEKCDFIICLSHLGYSYENDKISDLKLARATKHIDLILGGHTHTFLSQPDEVINTSGKKVWVSQAGWGGMILGRLDFYFDHVESAWSPQSTMHKLS